MLQVQALISIFLNNKIMLLKLCLYLKEQFPNPLFLYEINMKL